MFWEAGGETEQAKTQMEDVYFEFEKWKTMVSEIKEQWTDQNELPFT